MKEGILMLCDKCKKNQAQVHVTQVVNGHKTEEHLCHQCYNEAYGQGFELPDGMAGGWQNLFSSLLPQEHKVLSCPTCHTTYQQFKDGGLLGCADCYDVFASRLRPLLERIHGGVRHVGKPYIANAASRSRQKNFAPERVTGGKQLSELEKMQESLQQMIKEEHFEEAAILRDKIKELKGE